MANRRDLHVGIDADDRGFGSAFEDAQDKARDLDKELAKLERQQAANEKVTTRAAAAVDRFGRAQDKAALAAHRLGLEAKRAAEQAEKAEVRAAAAAEAAAKGLLDEEKAARLAARADDAVERASLKAAEAHRAQAHAADEAADQERQLARDAELAAAAERLAALKASGSVREHNALLGHLQAKFGDLSQEAGGAFSAIESSGNAAYRSLTSAAENFGQMGLLRVVGVANAIAALPVLASAAASALSLGLGGALATVALVAQAKTADVKAAFSGMTSDVSAELTRITAPFHGVLLNLIDDARKAFAALSPALKDAFASMAPAVARFGADFADAVKRLDPLIRSIGRAFAAVLDSIGPQLGTILGNVATGVKAIVDAAARNPRALTDLATGVSLLVRYLGDGIGILIRFKDQINVFFSAMGGGGPLGLLRVVDGITRLVGGIGRFLGLGGDTKQTANDLSSAWNQMGGAASTAGTGSQQLAKDMQTLATATATAEDKTNALSDAFTRLLDPQLAAYQDTARLRQGFEDLAAALVKSHGQLGDNSKAARDAKDAFVGLLKDAERFAGDLLRSGDSLDTVQRKLAPYILSLYRAAGGNRQARALVDAFVKTVRLVPPKKGTTLYNNAAQQKKAIEAYQRQINALHGKTVNIYQVMHLTETQAYLNKRKNILGYARGGLVRGYAAGGQVQRLADGGPSGFVTGPGTTTSDSILTRLSNKEFVVNARATAANLPLLEAINSGRSVPVRTAAVMSGASGGSSAPIDYDRIADALTRAMRRQGVGAAYLDGKAISDFVSRHTGRAADQRRRTG